MVVQSVEVPFLNKANTTFSVGQSDGVRFKKSKVGESTVKINCTLLDQLQPGLTIQKIKDELIRSLNTNSVAKLILSQMPDRYYNAIFDGEVSYDGTLDSYAEISLTFLVPDGVAYSIEEDYFTNANPKNSNLMVDSEFNNKDHYWKDFTKRSGKYLNSNTLVADFTDLVTIFGNENWLPKTTEVTIPVSVNVGDSVSFGMLVNTEVLPTNGETRPCTVILEERTKPGGDILKRHIVDAQALENTWQTIRKTVQITNANTKALCLTVGVRGNTRLKICKPQFNLGSTLNEYTASEMTAGDKIEVKNLGSYFTEPEIEVTMQGDNGLVGLVNSNGGILQYGDPDEVDIKRTAGKHMVFDHHWRGANLPDGVTLNDPTLSSVYPNYLDNDGTPNLVQGTVQWDGDEGYIPVFKGVGDIGVWHGPTLSWQIPKSANNTSDGDFLFAHRLVFKNPPNSLQTARARFEATVYDENKKPYMTIIVRDSSTLSSELQIEFWYKNKRVKNTSLPRKIYNGEFFEIHMDKMNSNKKLRWRFSQIKKLRPEDNGAYTSHDYEFVMNMDERELTNAVWARIWFMRFSNKHHNIMALTNSQFWWTNETVNTVRNTVFDSGDFLEINTKTRKVFRNGLQDRTLHSLGNQYEKFKFDYGVHTVQVVPSEWAINPIVGIKLKRVYF